MKEIVKFLNSKRFILFWLLFIIPLLTFIALRHSLKLSLWCDDWLQLWNVKYELGKGGSLDPYSLSSYLGPYAPQFAFLGPISHFFGYNPFPYYLVSMILRTLAAIGIYFMTFELTKNKLAGLISSAFFAVSAISLDTTNWVFNMNSYAGIIFLSPAFIFLIKSRTEGWFKFFLSWFFFLIAIALVPVRMHGVFIVVFLADLLWLLRGFKFPTVFKFLARQGLFILEGLLLKSQGSFGTIEKTYEGYLKGQVEFLYDSIVRGEKLEIVFYPFMIVGNMISSLLGRQRYEFVDLLRAHLGANPTVSLVIPSFSIFVFLIVLISFYLTKKKRLFIFGCIFAGAIWTFLNYFYLVLNLGNLLSPEALISSLIGGYFSIILLGVGLVLYGEKRELSDGLLLSLFWIYAFLLMPFVWQPTAIRAEHRYLTTSGIGVALSFGCLAAIISEFLPLRLKTLLKKKSDPHWVSYLLFFLPVLIFSLLFIRNISLSNLYLKTLVKTRGAKVYQEAWDSLLSQIPDFDKVKLSVFYFTSRNRYGRVADLHAVFGCGLGFRMGLIYDIDKTDKFPIPMVEFDKLTSLVTDLEFLKQYRPRESAPIPFERVYAFELVGNRVVDTREETIKALKQAIKAKAK